MKILRELIYNKTLMDNYRKVTNQTNNFLYQKLTFFLNKLVFIYEHHSPRMLATATSATPGTYTWRFSKAAYGILINIKFLTATCRRARLCVARRRTDLRAHLRKHVCACAGRHWDPQVHRYPTHNCFAEQTVNISAPGRAALSHRPLKCFVFNIIT